MSTTGKSIVLIQSRFDSKRLPGKALFPINGMPVVVLAALRAANTGKEILVVTSEEYSDDEICRSLEKYKINYFRGPLNNVLQRFYLALVGQPDERIVFRLTADNVMPDGALLDELEAQFCDSDLDIMSCSSSSSSVPYGVSAEVTRVKNVRDAFENSDSENDREHVTPYIYRGGRSGFFKSTKFSKYRRLRVTIDTYDDYISVKSLFEGSTDVVNDSIYAILESSHKGCYWPSLDAASKPMTLGTVQLGLNYGITNTLGKVKKEDAIRIIKKAITEGIEFIDTAGAYGDSESVLGEALRGGWRERVKIITKLRPFEINEYADQRSWSLAVRKSFYESCLKLNTQKIDVFMFHKYSNVLIPDLFDEVNEIKKEGLFEKLGVSVQTPQELDAVLDDTRFEFVQMPFNIIDHRWSDLIEKIIFVKRKRGLVVHARSALLQGLLCSDDHQKWSKAGVNNPREVIDWLVNAYKKYGKKSISDLCIGYVNSQPWIDSVVVGVDSLANLDSNLQAISRPPLSDIFLDDIVSSRPEVNSISLNPASWS